MNGMILTANILTFLAFLIHTFTGDRELKIIQPLLDTDKWAVKQEKCIIRRKVDTKIR